MNRNGKINAKKGPDKDYNAYKEFFDRETEAHVLAKWMDFAGMKNFEGSYYLNLYIPIFSIFTEFELETQA